jgi:hypothetical protein
LIYLRVKNWDRLQHPSPPDKPLPWIKFFTALLAPTKEPKYSEWSDATKALLHHIWLMARIHNNRIPKAWLTKQRLNLKSRVNLDPLLDSGFVWFEDENGNVVEIRSHAGARGRDARSGVSVSQSRNSSNTKGEHEGDFDQAIAFESVWSDYPRPLGRKQAEKCFRESVRSDDDLAAIRKALAIYKATIVGSEQRYIQHGKTWFNNWRDWLKVDASLTKGTHGTATEHGDQPTARELGMRTADEVLAAVAAKR